jgi:hypothetical protein
MVDRNYSVDYTSKGFGSGIATLRDGVITGSDAGFRWKGDYRIEGTKLLGSLIAIPESAVVNVFGDADIIELDFVGAITEKSIQIHGVRKGSPEHQLEAILRPIEV